MQTTEIDEALARKVLEVLSHGLTYGMGTPGQMCVEAAVNYAMGAEHGDNPACVAPALRRLKIRINDATWSSNQARADGLRRLAVAQLGSAGVLDEPEFARRVCSLALRTSIPAALKATAGLFRDDTATKERLLNAADLCSRTLSAPLSNKLRAIAEQFRADADAAAVADAAVKNKFWNAYWNARNKGSAKRDQAMANFCEGVVQILIEMGAPGCKFLYLTEAA